MCKQYSNGHNIVYSGHISKHIMSLINEKTILDLPTEVFHKDVFKYLTCKDIRSIGRTKSKRLKSIADDYIQRRIRK